MSGDRVVFVGDAMAGIVEALGVANSLIGRAPVVIGGLAVMARLSRPYRATVDLDVVDRLDGDPHIDRLRAASGAVPVQPSSVLIGTRYGQVRVDVLEVRQVELDVPSEDVGDRLHVRSHAWAFDTATDMTIEVVMAGGARLSQTCPVSEPGPLIAMKLQAVMDRSAAKQGTDLRDIVRLALDDATRPAVLAQFGAVDTSLADDLVTHIDKWLVRDRDRTLRRLRAAGDDTATLDDVDLVAEMLQDACTQG